MGSCVAMCPCSGAPPDRAQFHSCNGHMGVGRGPPARWHPARRAGTDQGGRCRVARCKEGTNGGEALREIPLLLAPLDLVVREGVHVGAALWRCPPWPARVALGRWPKGPAPGRTSWCKQAGTSALWPLHAMGAKGEGQAASSARWHQPRQLARTGGGALGASTAGWAASLCQHNIQGALCVQGVRE